MSIEEAYNINVFKADILQAIHRLNMHFHMEDDREIKNIADDLRVALDKYNKSLNKK